MLNKLLKRCMPWMDKGRWYKITVSGDSLDSININHDPVFSNVVMDSEGVVIATLAYPRPFQIIDIKFVGQSGTIYAGSPIYIIGTTESSYSFEMPNVGTVWLFINFG